jgi:YegS/Rv2252/BmrU family lipid kinase
MILLVINPVSGGLDKSELIAHVKEFCTTDKIELDIVHTTGENDREHISNQIKQKEPESVLVAGGDGTVAIVASVIKGTSIKLAIIPAGSANGFSKELNLTDDIGKILQTITNNPATIAVDLLCINKQHLILHLADVGINAQIVLGYEQGDDRGMMAYAKHFEEKSRTQKAFEFTLTLNDQKTRHQAVELAIANGRMFGSGVLLSRDGRPDDGKLEIVIVENVNLPIILRAGLSSMMERFFNDDARIIKTCKQALIEFLSPQLLQIDGEVVGKFSRLAIEVLPGAIEVVDTSE